MSKAVRTYNEALDIYRDTGWDAWSLGSLQEAGEYLADFEDLDERAGHGLALTVNAGEYAEDAESRWASIAQRSDGANRINALESRDKCWRLGNSSGNLNGDFKKRLADLKKHIQTCEDYIKQAEGAKAQEDARKAEEAKRLQDSHEAALARRDREAKLGPTYPPGGTASASGVRYLVVRQGTGSPPAIGATTCIHWVVSFLDGTVIEETRNDGAGHPIEIPLENQSMRTEPGFLEMLFSMRKGELRRFVLPPKYGWGDQWHGVIPPGSWLLYEIEVIDIK
ncbi:MAG: FKBP-type peptidyl-prolyl cis-trans isomerase [Spirochaetes bacterium]|nr:FKBP-type peptidyl-prolyl cis-trans isomerase [Spirochaetota bacterium]